MKKNKLINDLKLLVTNMIEYIIYPSKKLSRPSISVLMFKNKGVSLYYDSFYLMKVLSDIEKDSYFDGRASLKEYEENIKTSFFKAVFKKKLSLEKDFIDNISSGIYNNLKNLNNINVKYNVLMPISGLVLYKEKFNSGFITICSSNLRDKELMKLNEEIIGIKDSEKKDNLSKVIKGSNFIKFNLIAGSAEAAKSLSRMIAKSFLNNLIIIENILGWEGGGLKIGNYIRDNFHGDSFISSDDNNQKGSFYSFNNEFDFKLIQIEQNEIAMEILHVYNRILKKVASKEELSNFERKIIIANDLIGEGLSSDSLNQEFVDFISSLEVFFEKDDSNINDKVHRLTNYVYDNNNDIYYLRKLSNSIDKSKSILIQLRESISKLFKHNNLDMKQLINDLYNKRSKIVHGNISSKISELDLINAKSLAIANFRLMIIYFDEINKSESIEKWISKHINKK